MQLNITRSILRGKIAIPGSKSHTIRAIAIASLADGQSTINNPLLASDCVSAVMCYQALGANINASNHLQWLITGTDARLTHSERPIDVGNSGTTLRIAMGTAALAPKNAKIILTGDRQIRTRPVGPLIDSLNDLGAKVTSNKTTAAHRSQFPARSQAAPHPLSALPASTYQACFWPPHSQRATLR